MKRFGWQINLGLGLMALSVILYLLDYVVFRDAHTMLVYLMSSLAFLPLEVLLVILVLQGLLSEREKRGKVQKMNMVIGAFFSEVGTELLRQFSALDPHFQQIRGELLISSKWSPQEYARTKRSLQGHTHTIDGEKGDLESMRSFLTERWGFLLRLLENPNLLEHESFTELLWAVFHLTEELAHRVDVRRLSKADYEHLSGDIRRAYVLLIGGWLDYMKHLQRNYPYLFSLAIRLNPSDPTASAEIK